MQPITTLEILMHFIRLTQFLCSIWRCYIFSHVYKDKICGKAFWQNVSYYYNSYKNRLRWFSSRPSGALRCPMPDIWAIKLWKVIKTTKWANFAYGEDNGKELLTPPWRSMSYFLGPNCRNTWTMSQKITGFLFKIGSINLC